MAQYTRRFGNQSQRQDKSQPRFLVRRETAQPCNWTGCPAQATNQHKDKVYCASHLLRTLQKHWQE
jgi:hypothetical protein